MKTIKFPKNFPGSSFDGLPIEWSYEGSGKHEFIGVTVGAGYAECRSLEEAAQCIYETIIEHIEQEFYIYPITVEKWVIEEGFCELVETLWTFDDYKSFYDWAQCVIDEWKGE